MCDNRVVSIEILSSTKNVRRTMESNLLSCAFQASLLNNADEETNFGGDGSENEEDNVSEESEYSEDDDYTKNAEDSSRYARLLESRDRGRPVSVLRGKNGFVWSTEETDRRSDRQKEPDQVRIPGPNGDALNCHELVEFWETLMSDEIVETIVVETNKKIEELCLHLIAENEDLQTYHNHTNTTEMKAFIGLLYYAGLWDSNNVHIDELWSKENGISFYRCVMPRARFAFLSVSLRFDDKNSRRVEDRLAPIRHIWEIFIRNCTRNYQPHNWCTVDEQLLGFRGACRFRMYIKSKPDKCGLKIITLNDAQTSYLINAIPYLGKTHTGNENEPIPEYLFRNVTAPIHGTNRSVTCDNWFLSIPMLQRMLEPPYSMRITGTIRKNHREIPQELKIPSKEPPSTKFCFAKDLLLLSHTPRKNKVVLLASSYMHTSEINEGKPNVILHYDLTKGGTDCFDQLCRSYTSSRATQRWPLRFFFGMLDQAIVNASILHKCYCANQGREDEMLTTKRCMKKLISHLVKPHLTERLQLEKLRIDIRKGIEAILDIAGSPPRTGEEKSRCYSTKRLRCQLCTVRDDRKTKQLCSSCQRPMCDKHRVFRCIDCSEIE